MKNYVVVTVFDPADGKPRVVHAWGPPFPDRASAVAAKARHRRHQERDEAEYGRTREGTLSYHACEILAETPNPPDPIDPVRTAAKAMLDAAVVAGTAEAPSVWVRPEEFYALIDLLVPEDQR